MDYRSEIERKYDDESDAEESISWYGVGRIALFTENMDSELCRRLLNDNLLQTAKDMFTDRQTWWLLHDNDRKFHSELVSTWIHNHGVQVLQFPAYSPDLNPAENLLSLLKRRVREKSCRTVDELKAAITECWASIEEEFCEKLVDSMKKRCVLTMINQGYKTKY
jgi:hypothetical protein